MLETLKPEMQPKSYPEKLSAFTADAKTDPVAFAGLYNHYVQPVYRYLRSRVQTVQEAEDLTSETFIAAFVGLQRYRERGHFSAWLFKIARSKLMDHYRSSRFEVSWETIENQAEMDDAIGRVVHGDEVKRLAGLIQNLGEYERDLIQLRYVAGLSFAEMAEVLGKREDAIKKALYRLLANLKSQME